MQTLGVVASPIGQTDSAADTIEDGKIDHLPGDSNSSYRIRFADHFSTERKHFC